MIKIILLIIGLTACSSATLKDLPEPEKPKDYTSVIQEAEKNFKAGRGDYSDSYYRVTDSLQECDTYAKKTYADLLITRDQLTTARKDLTKYANSIADYQKQIKALTEEVETWRKLKFWFWTAIITFVIGQILWAFRGTIMTLLKARFGL